MNELKIFDSKEFGQIRISQINGEPIFCLADVCRILELTTPAKVKARLKQDGVNTIHIIDSMGRKQEATFISESNLYKTIFQSRKPEAERFAEWVTSEVLPSIRKTGGYVNDDELFIRTYLPNADEQTRLMFKSQLAVIQNLNKQLEQNKPKVLFADAVATAHTDILIGDLAKILKQNGIDIGQKRLFEWLRGNGYLMSQKGSSFNMPTQYSMNLGLFRVKETTINKPDGHITICKTTKVTGKGQQYFINKFLSKENNEYVI